ncbi:hypothetical protein Golax_019327 [Gossypium laxum]|uniref:Uncharacterized protein n=1 Tax=Gossypium laxum TaxID=34288 RepID=A0A7J8Z634_9ROSI|nr:hypothetical protein [Gossypium laxum]
MVLKHLLLMKAKSYRN